MKIKSMGIMFFLFGLTVVSGNLGAESTTPETNQIQVPVGSAPVSQQSIIESGILGSSGGTSGVLGYSKFRDVFWGLYGQLNGDRQSIQNQGSLRRVVAKESLEQLKSLKKRERNNKILSIVRGSNERGGGLLLVGSHKKGFRCGFFSDTGRRFFKIPAGNAKLTGRLQILKAFYGDLNLSRKEKSRVIDVTRKLKIVDNQVKIEGADQFMNRMFTDPAPGIVKGLLVFYRVGENVYVRVFNEYQAVAISTQDHGDAYQLPLSTASVVPAPEQAPQPQEAPVVAPAPVEPTPVVTPAPVEPAPVVAPTVVPVVEPAPVVAPAVVEPTPVVTPAPVEPAPVVAPTVVEPAPVVAPTVVEPAPVVAPAVVEPTPVVTPASVEPAAVVAPTVVEPTPVVTPDIVIPVNPELAVSIQQIKNKLSEQAIVRDQLTREIQNNQEALTTLKSQPGALEANQAVVTALESSNADLTTKLNVVNDDAVRLENQLLEASKQQALLQGQTQQGQSLSVSQIAEQAPLATVPVAELFVPVAQQARAAQTANAQQKQKTKKKEAKKAQKHKAKGRKGKKRQVRKNTKKAQESKSKKASKKNQQKSQKRAIKGKKEKAAKKNRASKNRQNKKNKKKQAAQQ